MLTGIMAAFFVILIGTAAGMAAGYCGGVWRKLLDGITSVCMAVPQLPFAIVLVTFLEPGIWNIVVAICLTSWHRNGEGGEGEDRRTLSAAVYQN